MHPGISQTGAAGVGAKGRNLTLPIAIVAALLTFVFAVWAAQQLL
ncbi:MAG: hypothetical protein AAGN82_31800 [Myxococcota bacterium]